MPGFAEFDKHDSSFNMKLSKKEVKEQFYKNKAYDYIESLGITTYMVNYKVIGNKLVFYYNIMIDNKAFTIKRIVNLDNYFYNDTKVRINKRTGILFNGTNFVDF